MGNKLSKGTIIILVYAFAIIVGVSITYFLKEYKTNSLEFTNDGKEIGVCTTDSKYNKYANFLFRAPNGEIVNLQFEKFGRDKNVLYALGKPFMSELDKSRWFPCPKLTMRKYTKEELVDVGLWKVFQKQVPNFYYYETYL